MGPIARTNLSDRSAEADAPLVDSFGRIASDLRISVTDKCNFRCTYCMPPEGLPWLSRTDHLDFDEIERVARVMVGLGIDSIKLTGGEPLVRKGIESLVRRLKDAHPDVDLSMTTNGFLLGDKAVELAQAGLDRVTVSCDSLLRHRFTEMTLRDALHNVMSGIESAAQAGLTPIKINAVVIRSTNDDEIESFAALARTTGYEIRFIEYMPLDAQGRWSRELVVPGAEILDRIGRHWPLESSPRAKEESEPGTTYVFADGAPGRVGVIPSVTDPFCDSCNRLRLTADGQLMSCLFSLEEVDLRGPLRAGASDDELAELIRACVANKWAGHNIGAAGWRRPARSMSMIGG